MRLVIQSRIVIKNRDAKGRTCESRRSQQRTNDVRRTANCRLELCRIRNSRLRHVWLAAPTSACDRRDLAIALRGADAGPVWLTDQLDPGYGVVWGALAFTLAAALFTAAAHGHCAALYALVTLALADQVVYAATLWQEERPMEIAEYRASVMPPPAAPPLRVATPNGWFAGSRPDGSHLWATTALIVHGARLVTGYVGVAPATRLDYGKPVSLRVAGAAIALQSGLRVAAIVAVNPLGDVIDPATGAVVAGARNDDGSLVDVRKLLRSGGSLQRTSVGDNTTIAVVATNARLTKTDASRLAAMADDGIARTIAPAHTTADGDTVFAIATGAWDGDANVTTIGALAADVLAGAIVRAVQQATSVAGIPAARDVKR